MATADTSAVTTAGRPFVVRTLRDLRQAAGLHVADLERATGINRADLSKIERGRAVATRAEIAAIAAALELPVESFELRCLLVHEERTP